jgi:hypothetical protein
MVATFLGSGHSQVFSQEIQQCHARIEIQFVRLAVDGEFHWDCGCAMLLFRLQQCSAHGRNAESQRHAATQNAGIHNELTPCYLPETAVTVIRDAGRLLA